MLVVAMTPVMAEESAQLTPAETALHQAAFAGDLAMTTRMVAEEGIAVDVADNEKHTPLMWASFNGHTAVVEYLIENGAKLNALDVNGRNALMYASSGPFSATVDLLLNKGSMVNVQGKLEGFTALMTAAAEGQLEVVRLLLIHGADPALKDEDNDTAEIFAVQKGHSAVAELLRSPPPRIARP
jgi:ankyrin repeat protein